MREFKLGREALILSILTLITVITWIGYEVYYAATKTTIPKVTQEQLTPLNPKLKKEIIEDLKSNLWYGEGDLTLANNPVSSESAIQP